MLVLDIPSVPGKLGITLDKVFSLSEEEPAFCLWTPLYKNEALNYCSPPVTMKGQAWGSQKSSCWGWLNDDTLTELSCLMTVLSCWTNLAQRLGLTLWDEKVSYWFIHFNWTSVLLAANSDLQWCGVKYQATNWWWNKLLVNVSCCYCYALYCQSTSERDPKNQL